MKFKFYLYRDNSGIREYYAGTYMGFLCTTDDKETATVFKYRYDAEQKQKDLASGWEILETFPING